MFIENNISSSSQTISNNIAIFKTCTIYFTVVKSDVGQPCGNLEVYRWNSTNIKQKPHNLCTITIQAYSKI